MDLTMNNQLDNEQAEKDEYIASLSEKINNDNFDFCKLEADYFER